MKRTHAAALHSSIFRYFLLILFCTGAAHAKAQNNAYYVRSWRAVDSLLDKASLPKSALITVQQIYLQAKQEHNEPQIIKSIIYSGNIATSAGLDINEILRQIQNEIAGASVTGAAMLQSIAATMLWNYLQQHRWEFYRRSTVAKDSASDINTWSAVHFHEEIAKRLIISLEDASTLQKTSLKPYDPILIQGNSRMLRPTLYDLLANRALDYFITDEHDLPTPAHAFVLNDADMLAQHALFEKKKITTTDTGSLSYKALLLFQELLRFHERDAQPDALIAADLRRLDFVYQHAAMPDKEALYLATIGQIASQYPTLSVAAQAWYIKAKAWDDKAQRYSPLGDTSNQYARLKARAICEQVMQQQDSSDGKSNCQRLLVEILRPSLEVETEKVNLPDLPFRALVTYKNIKQVFGRIIRVDDATRESLDMSDKDWARVLKFPVLKAFEQLIPDTKDFQRHRVEIKIDALPLGQYLLITADDVNFSGKHPSGFQFFTVSKIAYVQNGNDYFVLDRDSGHPLKQARVTCKVKYWNEKYTKELEKIFSYSTDENGFFRVNTDVLKNGSVGKMVINWQNDRLSEYNPLYYTLNRSNDDDNDDVDAADFEDDNSKVIFFTDRSIYRPGQRVYFKGIAITRDFKTKLYKVITGYRAKITLRNANNVVTDSLILSSNAFGSFQGEFPLQENGLTGENSIEDSASGEDRSFSVEEYKRPKFFVSFDTLRKSYRLNDVVFVSGNTFGYAGTAVMNAPVKFRVTRRQRITYDWDSRFSINDLTKEIITGETVTDANGRFSIRFVALPDSTIDLEARPIFDYEIATDVTDLNGETRSASETLTAGYASVNLAIALPDNAALRWDSLPRISIRTENLSGQFVSSSVEATIYQLESNKRLIRPRYWNTPDQFVMSAGDYVRNFPYDEYFQETNKDKWKHLDKVFEQTAGTTASGNFFTDKKSLNAPAGWYALVCAVRDSAGITTKKTVYFEIIGNKDVKSFEYLPMQHETETAEVGQKINLRLISGAEDVFVVRTETNVDEINRPLINKSSFFALSRETANVSLLVTGKEHGGFGVCDFFVKNNRFFSVNRYINVPWTNKDLQISYQTFRDKILPGSKETWKIKITGTGKDRAAAELLTGMYDASLDAFKPHHWTMPSLWPTYSNVNAIYQSHSFEKIASTPRWFSEDEIGFFHYTYDRLSGVSIGLGGGSSNLNDVVVIGYGSQHLLTGKVMGIVASPERRKGRNTNEFDDKPISQKDLIRPPEQIVVNDNSIPPNPVQIRRNFNETAFFFPQLHTDADGSVEFSFTMPEALTTWKWMLLAHTKDLAFGYSEKTIVTQKELMLQPNIPRFLRAGDTLLLPVKIANLSKNDFSGTVRLQWIDPEDSVQQDLVFQNTKSEQPFTIAAGQNTLVQFPVVVPSDAVKPIAYRLVVQTDGKTISLSDGEEAILPVLTNRLLVTESLPLRNHGSEKKEYHFDKLLHSGESKTLINQSLTVEYTANPAWYAVQSLPYVMEFPYECAEQTFNRFYANAVASTIVAKAPGISAVLTAWKNSDTSALMSNLQQNESLKSALLRETPWVLNAASEAEQHKHLALLYDLVHMNAQLSATLDQFSQTQAGSGGFAWFKGGRDDRYITQYILSGIGHLTRLQAIPPNTNAKLNVIIKKALPHLDQRLRDDYNAIDQKKNPDQLSPEQIQFLYMRSFFNEYPVAGNAFKALHYFRSQSIRLWQKQSTYMRGMIALALFRTGDIQTARNIMASIKEHATISAEQGMYFKDVNAGFYWQQAPVETQALLIEAFTEITQDEASVDGLRTWLLQQKRTSQWSTTRATADACYALLLRGTDWLNENPQVKIAFGDSSVSTEINHTTAGTGYIKKQVAGAAVTPSMGNISLQVVQSANAHTGPGWGSVYWQYFENMDKITQANSPLTLTRSLFVERNENGGPVLEPITAGDPIRPGDKIKVRLIIKSDRDLEYVHLKDLRASCFEPVDVLSEYRYQDGLGYYQTTSDASTSFFFDRIAKGTYVIEYELLAATIGSFSNGISTIQCMYAPEFAAHTEGTRVQVAPK